MKIKTSTLTGEKLDYWTAMAQEFPAYISEDSGRCYVTIPPLRGFMCYEPHINAGQAMELAKKFGLIVNFEISEVWKCGRTYPIGEDYSAICLAVVASVFGEEVDNDVS